MCKKLVLGWWQHIGSEVRKGSRNICVLLSKHNSGLSGLFNVKHQKAYTVTQARTFCPIYRMIWHNRWSCESTALIGCLGGQTWHELNGAAGLHKWAYGQQPNYNSPRCYRAGEPHWISSCTGMHANANYVLTIIYAFNSQLQIWMPFHIHSWSRGFTEAIQVTRHSLGRDG